MSWAAILGLYKRLSPALLAVSVVALLSLGGWAIAQKVKASSTINDLTKQVSKVTEERDAAKLELADARILGAKQLADKIEENRLLNLGWQKRFDQAEEDRSNEKRRLDTAVAAATGERDRLRRLTATLTRPDPSIASGGACNPTALRRASETAETLGGLLGTSDGISQGLGAEAEELAGQVRGLQSAFEALINKVEGGELVLVK